MVRLISRRVTEFLLLILLSTPAFAGIGSITDFRGAGNIKRAARVMPAARGSGIEKNDTVSTNSLGRFRITFSDQTTVNITENSRLVIDDFVFNGGGNSKGRLGLKIALGTVRYASGGIAHGNPGGVNIRTPTATIGVRGTDFVMSVDEIGRTTVVLLPACYDDKDPLKNTTDCPVGSIDVITAAGVVRMNQPFQATVVENTFTPPSPPVVINLSMRQLDNALQVSSPPTTSGVSLLSRARADVQKASNPSAAAAESNKDPQAVASAGPIEQTATVVTTQDTTQQTIKTAETSAVYIDVQPEKSTPVPLKQTLSKVSPIYQKQILAGWVYSSLSSDNQQAATIWQNKETQVQITVTQNGVSDSYNFVGADYPNTGTGRAQGNITINQQSVVPK